MDKKRRKLDPAKATTQIIIRSKSKGLEHEKVKALVEKLLKCRVLRSKQLEGLGKGGDDDDDDDDRDKSGVILVFAKRDVALKTLNLDYKLEEVFGVPVTISEAVDRRKQVHEFRLKDQFKDAFESDSDDEKAKGPKRSFSEVLHSKYEQNVTVNKLKTVCAMRCPATMREPKAVRAKFARCGPIRNVVVRTDSSGMFKGVAYIEFTTEEGAQNAIKTMHMAMVDGNRINVRPYKDDYAAPSSALAAPESIHAEGFKKSL